MRFAFHVFAYMPANGTQRKELKMKPAADRSAESNGTHDQVFLGDLLANAPVAPGNHQSQHREGAPVIQQDAALRVEILLKQCELSLNEIRHLDKSNVQITLLFIALISAYIGVVGKGVALPGLFSLVLALFGTCIIGIIVRLRFLIRQHKEVVSTIRKALHMVAYTEETTKGFARIKMSSYLGIIIVILTSLAIALTLFK
jgi:hypothetical protein